MKLILTIYIFLFTGIAYPQRLKIEPIKIKVDDLRKIKVVKDLIPTLPAGCQIISFNFEIYEDHHSVFIGHQLGDTSKYCRKERFKTGGKDVMNLRGDEWLDYVSGANPGAEFFVDAIRSTCPSSVHNIFKFVVVK